MCGVQWLSAPASLACTANSVAGTFLALPYSLAIWALTHLTLTAVSVLCRASLAELGGKVALLEGEAGALRVQLAVAEGERDAATGAAAAASAEAGAASADAGSRRLI